MRGYSGMVTFYIKGGENEARKFLSSLKVTSILFQLIHIFKLVLDITIEKCFNVIAADLLKCQCHSQVVAV